MTLTAEQNISFEDAIALTQNFVTQIVSLSDSDKEKTVTSLVASENGARGFFVTYLTSDDEVVDKESAGIIAGLKTSPEIVSELLVKNVAMSSAMKLTHLRNENEAMAQNSQRVTSRSLKFLAQLDLAESKEKIQQLQDTIANNDGVYQKFLTRWKYDDEQKQAMTKAFL